jgi:hypothetical protein
MRKEYWFFDRGKYERLLAPWNLTESDFLSALREIASIFPPEKTAEAYQDTICRIASLDLFSLIPHPNERLQYNPIPVMLSIPDEKSLRQLIYLGRAICEFKSGMGRSKAFNDLASSDIANYRGALFEIEVGSELVRGELKPKYSSTTPDFICANPSLGVEVTLREVPILRAIVEQLMRAVGFLDFGRLEIRITSSGQQNVRMLVENIATNVESMLKTGELELSLEGYEIRHDPTEFGKLGERIVSIEYGKYKYEETLAHLLKVVLEGKEEQISNATEERRKLKHVAAIDVRSLLGWPIVPDNEHKQRHYERNRAYFDKLKEFREEIHQSCKVFVSKASLIRGVLLWERRPNMTGSDEVHRPNIISLITDKRTVEVNKDNLAAELNEIA